MKDDGMNDDELDALLRDAARTYDPPPELADADATWRAIERALPRAGAEHPSTAPMAPTAPPTLTVIRADAHADGDTTARPAVRRAPSWLAAWVRAAAVLLVGVAIGRATVRSPASDVAARGVPAARADRPAPTAAIPGASLASTGGDPGVTGEYLARIELLLADLPDALRARRGDPAFQARADALLLQTRLLLDSPAAADPTLRALFDDLEIVLAQLVRLDAIRDPMDVDFLEQALEQRDVMPRLRDAVTDHAADRAAD
jgi:hypothetical protein